MFLQVIMREVWSLTGTEVRNGGKWIGCDDAPFRTVDLRGFAASPLGVLFKRIPGGIGGLWVLCGPG